MYLKIGNDFYDPELYLLSEFLGLIDLKLSEIKDLIDKSSDPDSEGLCDKGEYYIGIGFVVTQQYLIDTLTLTKINKVDAYSLGQKHDSGETYINLINAAANWWKHEAEWINNNFEVPKNGMTTIERIKLVANSDGYELSQILYSLCRSNKLSFKALTPILIEWREAIDVKRRQEEKRGKNSTNNRDRV